MDENVNDIHALDCAGLLERLRVIVETADMNAHREVTALKTAFYARRNREQLAELSAFVAEGNAPETFSAAVCEHEAPFRDLLQQFKEARAAFLEADAKQRQENLEKKEAIIAELRTIAEDIDNVNLNFQKFQQLQQDFREKADLPPTAETDIWKKYQLVTEEFYDKLKINKELRDLDFRKNLDAKRQLIQEAKALAEVEDVIEAIRKLQTLHNSWREIGPVAKELRNEIWDEFKEASVVVNKRHQAFFEARKASEQQSEEKKTALCEEAEKIASEGRNNFNEWEEATAKIIELQTQWKDSGFASRKTGNALYARFRAACDNFFNAKSEFFKQQKTESADNLAKKVALCEKAEALASEENLKRAAEQAAALQAEWKLVGPVSRKHSEEIWKRFSAACNDVFDRRNKFMADRRKEESANLAAKKALIQKLSELDVNGDAHANIDTVKECQKEWNQIGFVPSKVKEELWKEFRGLCDKFYEALRKGDAERRDNRYRDRARQIKSAGNGKVISERERILRDIERKQVELNTYKNNLGFFMVKSSAGNSMVKEMERKQARIQADIDELQRRLKMLDAEPASEA